MIGGPAHPDVHLSVWIEIHIDQAEKARLVLKRLADPFQQRGKIHGHDIQADAQPGKVLLHQGGHAFARAVAGICDHGEFHRMAVAIAQHPPIAAEAVGRQQAARRFQIERLRLEPLIKPKQIGP